MKFICLEIDKQATLKDLCTPSKLEKESNLTCLFTIKDGKNGKVFYHGNQHVTNLLTMTENDTANKTIAEYMADTGITVASNLGTVNEAKDFTFKTNEPKKLKTEMWFTLFTDEGIKFYRPQRLDTSKQIPVIEVLEEIGQNCDGVGIINEPDPGEINASYSVDDTVWPILIDIPVKNLLVNAYKASCNMKRFKSVDANPLDYGVIDGTTYLIISKKEQNGDYIYLGVKEESEYKAFTGADIAMPTTGTGVTSFNGRTGDVTPASGDYDLADCTADSTHRTVTDTEKATWNGKTDWLTDQVFN